MCTVGQGSSRRRAWLFAAAVAVACVSQARGESVVEARPSRRAMEAARAAWRGLPTARDASPGRSDPIAGGGIATFYGHARSLLTVERLEQLAGMRSTLPPPASARRDAVARAFRHYDPRFVAWLRAVMLQARSDPRFREETQPIYDRYVAPVARRYLATRRLMSARPAWLDAEVRWVRSAIEGGTLPHRYYLDRYAEFGLAPEPGEEHAGELAASVRDETVPHGVAFWIRRELDGTAGAFSAALEELVSLYDRAWLAAGAGIARGSPVRSAGEPFVLHPSARLCGVVREQRSVPPDALLSLATELGTVRVVVPGRRFEVGARVCVGDLRAVDEFRSSALDREVERVFFGVERAGPAVGRDAADAGVDGGVLVEGAGVRVSAGDLQVLVAMRPREARASYASESGRRALVENLVKSQLILHEARRRGLDRGPDGAPVNAADLRRALGAQIHAAIPPPTEAEIRADFDRLCEREALRGGAVRMQVYVIDASPGDVTRQSAARTAEVVRERLRVAESARDVTAALDPPAPDGKSPIVRDEGLLTRREVEGRHGAPVASAVFEAFSTPGLAEPGYVTSVIGTSSSFIVARIPTQRPDCELDLEKLRDRIAKQLASRAEQKETEALLARLRAEAGVRIDEVALAGVELR